MKKAIVLASGLGLVLLGFGAEMAPAGAVVGWWKFDDASAPGKDSSDYRNDLDGLSNVTPVAADTGYTTRGSYDDSGCLYIGTAGKTATATAKYVWDTTKGYTYLMRIRSGISISAAGDKQAENLLNLISDNGGWHLIALRYDNQKVTGSTNKYYYWLFGDDPTVTADDRSEVVSDSLDGVYFPLSTDISVGGKVGAKVKYIITIDKSAQYKGYMDDIAVVCRTMTKDEVKWYYLTADPNPYLTSDNDAAFAGSTGWSCGGEGLTYGPHNLPGADFEVNNGRTLKSLAAHAGMAFGGHSLTLGRLAPLTSRLDGTTLASVNGNFSQQASVTVGDLRLNSGKITGAAETALTVTKLAVNATSASPYELTVASGAYSLNVGAATTGSGVLSKTGAGKLTVNAWTGTAKLRLSEGSLKSPRFNGYAGGTVLVSTDSTVAFAGDDVLPTTANKMKILFDGTKPTAKTAVMTVPASVTAAMIQDTTEYANGQIGLVTVENGTVSVEPVYPEDQGAVPVLMAE